MLLLLLVEVRVYIENCKLVFSQTTAGLAQIATKF